ncbi:hypothetical protein EV217_5039 [Phyllobacterium myrsinacearum]|uniref:hypothetical protein n=1 Tax=Phyllobacterium myrsinacearum TaxID=28101 RepID=UPI00102A1076|nr:hypothetical protein [Phyllobacterium myrsinacearum]RZS76809.1 hypothetical protein EV217_5039 [Phyllobacterium myrsinacearum]
MAARKWITFLQVHYLANDGPWWQTHRNTGPIGEFRQAFSSFNDVVAASPNATMKADLGDANLKLHHHLNNLDAKKKRIWLRIAWHITIPVIIGWTLWVAITLNEWAQFLSQLAVLTFTLTLAAALVRNDRATNWINFKLWEDRLIGDLPTLLFYTVATQRPGLHKNYHLVIIVGVITGILLLVVSLTHDLWSQVLLLRSTLRSGQAHLSPDARTNLIRARDVLWEKTDALQTHVEQADISGGFQDGFLLLKKATHHTLATVDCYLPKSDRRPRPRYPWKPKVPAFALTIILQGLTLYAASEQPWFLSYNGGWALWMIVRMALNFRGYVSQKDVNRLFTSIVAGSAMLMPLTLLLLIGGAAALEPLWVKLVLGLFLIILVTCFSNILSKGCDALSNWLFPERPAADIATPAPRAEDDVAS